MAFEDISENYQCDCKSLLQFGRVRHGQFRGFAAPRPEICELSIYTFCVPHVFVWCPATVNPLEKRIQHQNVITRQKATKKDFIGDQTPSPSMQICSALYQMRDFDNSFPSFLIRNVICRALRSFFGAVEHRSLSGSGSEDGRIYLYHAQWMHRWRFAAW